MGQTTSCSHLECPPHPAFSHALGGQPGASSTRVQAAVSGLPRQAAGPPCRMQAGGGRKADGLRCSAQTQTGKGSDHWACLGGGWAQGGVPTPEVGPEAERGCPRFFPASGVEMGQKGEVTPDFRSPRESWGGLGAPGGCSLPGLCCWQTIADRDRPCLWRAGLPGHTATGAGPELPGWLAACLLLPGRKGRERQGTASPGRKEGGRVGGNEEEVACLTASCWAAPLSAPSSPSVRTTRGGQ